MEIIISAVILGIVEGLTEFLPVSSTGHLILCGHLLGFNTEFGKTFSIAIQSGAMISVVIYFRKKILSIFKRSLHESTARHFIASVFLAFLPAAFWGLLFNKWIKSHLFSPTCVGAALILGGIAILVIEKRPLPPNRTDDMEDISFAQALLIGCAQCLAMVPGVSRSAATILGGMIFGLGRTAAVEFSFFLALPTMFAATAYSVVSDMDALNLYNLKVLALGFSVSFVVALGVIAWFMDFIKKYTFVPFGWYRIGFGTFSMVLLLT